MSATYIPPLIVGAYWRESPHPKQLAALSLYNIEEILFGGAAGGGKSSYLLQAASQFVHSPHWVALLLRKTYQDLSEPGAIMDRAKKWWRHQDNIHWDEKLKRFTFPTGAIIQFGHLETRDAHLQYQGAEFRFIGIDEASQIPQYQIEYMKSRIRQNVSYALPLQLRLTSNPGGVSHQYLKETYVDTENTLKNVFLPSGINDNPTLDDSYREQLEKLDPVTKAQLLHGDWNVTSGMGYFKLSDFKFVDPHEVPVGGASCRSWDMASTPVNDRNKDPDFTSGGLVRAVDGRFFIEDIRRFRKDPAGVENEIRNTGNIDGTSIPVLIEQEKGSAGKALISHYSRHVLRGHLVVAVPVTGSKPERAKIFAGSVANGNVYIVRNRWNRDFLAEAEAFPQSGHDDQIDCLAQAVHYLNNNVAPNIFAV